MNPRPQAKGVQGGFTLLELSISLAIFGIAILAVTFMMIEGGKMARNAEQTGQSNDVARFAGEVILNKARAAGLGAGNGIWINQAGAARNINPVFGVDGNNAPDEIWMVVPGSNAFREACVAPGSAATVVARGATNAAIQVNCTTQVLGTADGGGIDPQLKLLMTDLTQATMLTGVSETTRADGTSGFGAISYADGTFVPPSGTVDPGSFIYPAKVLHFFVRGTGDGGTALYLSEGNVNLAAPPALPFADSGPGVVVARDVEDLQIAYGIAPNQTTNPDNYVFVPACAACSASTGFSPSFDRNNPLRSLRVNVVAHGSMVSITSDGTAADGGAGFIVENNDAGYPPNGFRRSWYSRRVEPRNLNPGAL